MKNIIAACMAGVALMACTPSAPDTSTPGPSASATDTVPETNPAPPMPGADPAVTDTCGMAQHAALIGKPVTDAGVPAEGPNVRHLRPDTQMTLDFRPDRLNIEIDANGVITGFRCT